MRNSPALLITHKNFYTKSNCPWINQEKWFLTNFLTINFCSKSTIPTILDLEFNPKKILGKSLACANTPNLFWHKKLWPSEKSNFDLWSFFLKAYYFCRITWAISPPPPPVMTNWAISSQQQRKNSTKRRQQTQLEGWCVYSTQSIDQLKFIFYEYRKKKFF